MPHHYQTDRPSSPPVLTVSALTLLIKEVVEGSFPLVWVSGEISNFSRPQSGHCYLTLKDDQAQIRAVIWRGTAATIRCDLHDGLEVICRGHLDLYALRGSYQLVVDELQPKGLGALEQALRRLREKLAAEGLFDRGRKRPFPTFPRRIAVITSPTGAAIRDFLQVLNRRWRGCDVLIVPVRVQGVGSAEEIARAIATVNRLLSPVDVLVVARGGGSLEDLWAFNEEPVVRAIAASRIPVVSGVGHEIDVTLADLAADLRALTPAKLPNGLCRRSTIFEPNFAAGNSRWPPRCGTASAMPGDGWRHWPTVECSASRLTGCMSWGNNWINGRPVPSGPCGSE